MTENIKISIKSVFLKALTSLYLIIIPMFSTRPKKHIDRGVTSAAKGLLTFYRQEAPMLLHKDWQASLKFKYFIYMIIDWNATCKISV